MASRPALCIVDMQRYFVDPKGTAYHAASKAIIGRVDLLKERFVRAGLPVIFTQHGHSRREEKHPLYRWWSEDIIVGTEDHEIDPRLEVTRGCRVVRKDQYSAFRSEEFRRLIRKERIGALVIAGVMTNLCCETTARDAFMENLDVYLLADGTAALTEEMHLGTLRNIAYGFGYITTCKEVAGWLR
jgi:isochorismate hydrolase